MKIGFYDKLDEIDKSLLEAKNDVLSTERQLDKEIDMVKERFMPTIEQKKLVVEEKKQELYDLKCNIVKYSKFNINSFGKILATLVSVVEGIDYRYSTEEKLSLGFDEANYFIKISPSNLLAYNNSIKEHVISGKILLIG